MSRPRAASPKAEAIRALEHALGRLASGEPFDGLAKMHLAATLEYAKQQVAKTVERQRARPEKTEEEPS